MGTRGSRPPRDVSELSEEEREARYQERMALEEMRQKGREEEIARRKEYEKQKRQYRKTFTKKEREAVYKKYNGHCAYCGCEMDIKDMHIDHAASVAGYYYGIKESMEKIQEGTLNDIDNLMPSCRQCNFYKSILNIEHFRYKLKEILQRTCVNTFQAKLAMKYGMLEKHEWDGKFYFEKVEDTIS